MGTSLTLLPVSYFLTDLTGSVVPFTTVFRAWARILPLERLQKNRQGHGENAC